MNNLIKIVKNIFTKIVRFWKFSLNARPHCPPCPQIGFKNFLKIPVRTCPPVRSLHLRTSAGRVADTRQNFKFLCLKHLNADKRTPFLYIRFIGFIYKERGGVI